MVAGSSGLWINSLELILSGRALLGRCRGHRDRRNRMIADYYTGRRTQILSWQSAMAEAMLSLGGVFLPILTGECRFDYLVALFLLPLVNCYLPEPRRIAFLRHYSTGTETESVNLPLGLVAFTCVIALINSILHDSILQLPSITTISQRNCSSKRIDVTFSIAVSSVTLSTLQSPPPHLYQHHYEIASSVWGWLWAVA